MNNNNPLISILCPVYGVEKYIGECLDSLFNQSYTNLEYVFVNDNTPDKSMEILTEKIREYGLTDKVVIINNEKNVGLAGVRIECIKAAKGEYITIVDTDDKLSLDAIEKYVHCAISNDADIVEADLFLYSPDGIKEYRRPAFKDKDDLICQQLSINIPVALWSKLYKRELFYDVDNLFIVGSKNIEDYYATPVLYDRAKNISHLCECVYYYRIGIDGSGSKNNSWSKIESLYTAFTHHEKYFSSRDSLVFKNALNEAKYNVIKSNYSKLSLKSDRKKLSNLFCEADDFVKNKGLTDRIMWWLIRHNLYLVYSFIIHVKKMV